MKKSVKKVDSSTKNEHPRGPVCRIPLPLEEGKHVDASTEPPRMYELTWRIFRIMAEFVEGFQFLSESEKEVTVFGSARFPEDHKWYKESRKLGALLAEKGYTVITGGGPGIMEAANRGADDEGGVSIGLNIQLPSEQRINPYVNRGHAFHYFFTRKVMLAASAQAYVFFPGGFGTMDELFEMLTLIQTHKSQPVPVVLVGKAFWTPLVAWIRAHMLNDLETIGSGDLDIFSVVDRAEDAIDLISCSEDRSFF